MNPGVGSGLAAARLAVSFVLMSVRGVIAAVVGGSSVVDAPAPVTTMLGIRTIPGVREVIEELS